MSFKCMPMGSDPIVIHFIGAMTEDADLSMLRVPKAARLEIELSQLTSINSIGIREMRTWSQSLENEDIKVTFAPKCFVDQINMVPDLLPRRAAIDSFYVPYYSEQTGEESRALFTLGTEFTLGEDGFKLNPPVVSDSQGGAMEPDVVMDNYFAFLNRRI